MTLQAPERPRADDDLEPALLPAFRPRALLTPATVAEVTQGWWGWDHLYEFRDRSRREPFWRLGLHFWGLINLGLIAAAVLLNGSLGLSWIDWILSVAVLLLSTAAQIYLVSRPPKLSKPTRQDADLNLVSRRVVSLHRAAYRMDCEYFVSNHIAIYTRMAVDPGESRRRVEETVTVTPTNVTKEASLDVAVSSELLAKQEGMLAIPVMRPFKGRLIGDFSIRSGAGEELSTLTAEESLAYTARVVHSLFVTAFAVRTHPDTGMPLNADEYLAYTGILESLTYAPGRRNLLPRAQAKAFREETLRKFDETINGLIVHEQDAYESLRRLVRIAASNYAVIAVIPAAERLSIAYRYSVTLRSLAEFERVSWWRRAQGAVRAAFSGVPRVISIPISKAKRCDSYHLRVSVPQGVYVATARVLDSQGRVMQRVRSLRNNLGDPYLRLAGQGTSDAYVYARSMRSFDDALTARIEIGERLPGAVARALGVAVAVMGAVAVLGSGQVNISNLDSPALLVATLPAVFVIIGFITRIGTGRVEILSLAGLASAVMSSLLLIASAFVLVTSDLDVSKPAARLAAGGFAGMVGSAWSIIFSAAVTQTILLVGVFATRLLRMRRSLTDDGNIDEERIDAGF